MYFWDLKACRSCFVATFQFVKIWFITPRSPTALQNAWRLLEPISHCSVLKHRFLGVFCCFLWGFFFFSFFCCIAQVDLLCYNILNHNGKKTTSLFSFKWNQDMLTAFKTIGCSEGLTSILQKQTWTMLEYKLLQRKYF